MIVFISSPVWKNQAEKITAGPDNIVKATSMICPNIPKRTSKIPISLYIMKPIITAII